MANHASAEKRYRQNVKRRERNRSIRSKVRTHVKKVRVALGAGGGAQAESALQTAVSLIERAVAKGVYHRKTASRYISRLTAQVKTRAAA